MTEIKAHKVKAHASKRGNLLQHTQATQLSNLSSVLNGLEGGACAMRKQVQEAMNAIQAGTYWVDPMQLSRCIVGETLRAL